MEITLIEDTFQVGLVHPTQPVIFHFDTFNSGEETILVDIIKSEAVHPDDWDISICTVACLPPETDEALFPIGAMLEEEVSIYFFPPSPGTGTVHVFMQSQADSSETYEIDLYLEAVLTTDVEYLAPSVGFEQRGDLIILEVKQASRVFIYDGLAHLKEEIILQAGRNTIDLSSYNTGIYTVVLYSNGQQAGAWKALKD
jgi:hypothetical protein